MNPTSPARAVLDEAATWAGITTRPTARGATAILFEGHELGHVHAKRGTLDLPLPADRRAQVLQAGRAKEWFSGWVTKQLASRADADGGIALLRESYDAAARGRERPRWCSLSVPSPLCQVWQLDAAPRRTGVGRVLAEFAVRGRTQTWTCRVGR